MPTGSRQTCGRHLCHRVAFARRRMFVTVIFSSSSFVCDGETRDCHNREDEILWWSES
ncbi:hypothetical protein TIFTF001_034372 [Ficus carica]|uniref:Uncharacterized protein n=1 Tax=Ficus carica TaxID=3494 RepID=A0AA88J912_FICCA|nr:hypothetical protein TIFTF001_034372 [Ficus carica]